MTNPATSGSTPATVTPVGEGRLALLLQEALTVTTRLRAGRQPVTDPAAFRAQMLQLLRRADQEAQAAGYDAGDVQLAVFAVVALLDESALNSREPAFADWARRPLQDELFGGHMAGEWFFQHVERLLARPDSAALADLLEVHHLALLLGFRGRYGADDRGALHAIASQVAERIQRMRGARSDLVPGWRPPDDLVLGGDPWVRRLVMALVATLVLAGLVWGGAALSLSGATSEVAAMASLATPPAPSAP